MELAVLIIVSAILLIVIVAPFVIVRIFLVVHEDIVKQLSDSNILINDLRKKII